MVQLNCHMKAGEASCTAAIGAQSRGFHQRLPPQGPHLVVALLDGGGEVTVGGHHEQAHVGLGSAGNHVLDEIAMACGVGARCGAGR